MKLNANFRHLNKTELSHAYRNSKRRLIFLDYEGTIVESDYTDLVNENSTPSSRVVKLLSALSNDSKNTIFIVSGRERKHLSEWFSSISNLGLAAEHGFFYKYGQNMTALNENISTHWNELFKVKDWSWKDSVLKILQGFTEKTEGSFINVKDSIVSWWYKDCDIYFGHVQANEIKTHLQNIYDNCKLDVVNGKGYVEIKPQNVNKGFFLSYILKKMFINKIEPDFILSIGDGTSDEEMFNYLNSVSNTLNYLRDDIKIFTSTIGRKPSSAKFYLNEIHEVLEYLETLNQTKKESGRLSSTRIVEINRLPKRNTMSAYDIQSLSNLNL
jgi:trehalose 6-phosphate synthase/phosphatase